MRELIERLRDMHASSQETRGVGRWTDTNDKHWTPYCEYDKQDWPCETVELLNEYAEKLPKPTARPPHPATMIGRTNRAVCLLDADCIAGVDHDGECIQ